MTLISPELFIACIKVQWEQLSLTEKRRMTEHAHAHAVSFYFDKVPDSTKKDLDELEAECR